MMRLVTMHKKMTTLVVTSAFLMAGCTDPSRFQSAPAGDNTKQGAIIGGMIGVASGLLSGDKDKAVKRGIIGAGVGAIAGNQLDKQEADLRRSMGNDNVIIRNTGDRLIVTLPQDILFATDSATLRYDLQSDLRALAANLQQYPMTTVQIIGHTDNVGDAAYNQSLSVARAESVTGVLVQNGVAPNRLVAFGRGEDQPIASNLTAEGRQQNRRVDIVILPNAQ